MVSDQVISDESYIEKRNMLLKQLDVPTIRKAWFTLSHLLVADGSHVVDMGCDDGAMTYAMAAMNPKVKFTGIDKNKRQINKAREKFEIHNLEFKIADASTEIFGAETVDAIINSYTLHDIYSGSRYNERIVSDTLRTQFKMLKKGGVMFIRDYARPPHEELVLLEMPDIPSESNDLSKLSEADLLMWYSEHARPRHDPGTGGFFLEELPGRFPGTRLFRLPYKWAYEFIMRKDDRAHWEKELPIEYTFYTDRDFRKELSVQGARVQYSGPYWEEDHIEKNFEGKFRLYKNDGTLLGNPPTCFIAVAYKMAERKSLHIEERRSTANRESTLKVTAMRDTKTGKIVDVVSRNFEAREIIPYRVDEEGRLKVYLHDGVVESITNSVTRNGINIDGRRWSGHMVEAITVDGEAMSTMEEFDVKHTARFARDYLGLKPKDNAILELGPDYYPAPDFIDERIYTYYLSVTETKGAVVPKNLIAYAARFQAKGHIREMDAQQILNAITVGMLPNSRLELQILSLFNRLKIKPETWADKQFNVQAGKISGNLKIRDILRQLRDSDKRFQDARGASGDLRTVHSTFVEEGQMRGSTVGISSQNVDFVVHDSKTINTVVVLPLTRSMRGDMHAGFLLQHLPVPQRHEGNGLTISAPSFNLPPHITNIKDIKKLIAEKFGVLPDMVIKMGESYYSHIGVTPQKIYPFAVAAPPDKFRDPDTNFLPMFQFMLLWNALKRDTHFMTLIARTHKYFSQEMRMEAERKVTAIVRERFAQGKPDWSIPASYRPSPITKTIEAPTPEQQPVIAPWSEAVPQADGPRADVPPPSFAAGFGKSSGLEYLEELLEALEKEDANSPKSGGKKQGEEKPADSQGPQKVNMIAKLADEFEKELVDIIDALEKEETHRPRPEKW